MTAAPLAPEPGRGDALRVLFAGTPDVAIPTLRALVGSRHHVVAALTRPPARRSRRGHDEPSPVAATAAELGVPVLEPRSVRATDVAEELRALDLDVAVVVAYGALLPEDLLAIPRHGWINLHFSVLPAWRGAAPVQHAVWHGDEVTGATTFRITAGLDEGPVYGVLTERVRPRDTSGDLLARLADAGPRLVLDTLDAVADGTARPQAQPDDGVTLAPRLSVEQARVRWADPALAVDRQVRACTPAPGAWTTLDGARVKVGPLDPVDAPPLPAGRIAVERQRVLVGTGSAPVELGRLAPAGKGWMDAASWARGARLAGDATFGADDG